MRRAGQQPPVGSSGQGAVAPRSPRIPHSKQTLSSPSGSGRPSRVGAAGMRSFSRTGGTILPAALRTASESSDRAISASRFRTDVRPASEAMASTALDPHHLLRVARELDEPDGRVEVGAVLQQGDDRDPLLGLGAEDQPAQADLLLGQAPELEDDDAVPPGSSDRRRAGAGSSRSSVSSRLRRANEMMVCLRTSELVLSI